MTNFVIRKTALVEGGFFVLSFVLQNSFYFIGVRPLKFSGQPNYHLCPLALMQIAAYGKIQRS